MVSGYRPFVSWLVIFSMLVPLVPAYGGPIQERIDKYEAEAARLEQAYNSFSDREFETMRGPGFLWRIVEHGLSWAEAVPVLGEEIRDRRETDATEFTDAELEPYLKADPRKNVESMINFLFRETIGFVHRLSAEEEIPQEVRTEIIKGVIEKTADTFNQMTEGFQDPLPPARSWDDVSGDYRGSGYWQVLSPLHFGAQWLLAQAQWIGREITAMFTLQAVPIPLLEGSAERRSHSTEQLAREIRVQVRKDAARLQQLRGTGGFGLKAMIASLTSWMQTKLGKGDTRNREQVLMSLVAMEELINATDSSEVMQHGTRNRVVRRFYIGLAMLFLYFGGPEIGPLLGWSMGFAERTMMGSIAAMVQWVGFSLWLARSRRQNSGLQYHKEVFGGATPIFGKRGLLPEIQSLTNNPDGKDFADRCHVQLATSGKRVVDPDTVSRGRRSRRFSRI